jgi:two-component system sensor histidine kinase QseC
VRSVRGRLIVWLLAGTGVLLGGAFLTLDQLIGARLHRDFDADLIAEARSVMAVTEEHQGRVVVEWSAGLLPAFEAASRRADYFEVWVPGRVLARSPSLGRGDLPRFAAASKRFRFASLRLPDGRPGRRVEVTFRPLVESDAVPPEQALAATLGVARGSEDLDAFLRSLHLILALFGLGLLLASAALVKTVATLALRPLDELAGRLATLDAGSLQEPVVIDRAPSELAPTLARLNDLLARLAASFERERTFSANAAHELRTPLAELRTVTEVALKWPDDPATLLGALGEVRGIGLQMERVVGNLLALARYDAGTYTVGRAERREVPLRAVVQGCWSAVAEEAAGRGLTLDLEIPEELRLATDPEKLELLLANLVGNAASYAAPGSVVTCSASAADGSGDPGSRCALTLANRTTELTPDDRPHLFDRYWRKDAARSDGRHAGLGLSLVAALCDLLGIEREVELCGDLFSIRLVFQV